MIIKDAQRKVAQSDDFKSEIASIDAEEMRYVSSLLRNNYSNPILATVRELIANASDANVGPEKIEIHCPTFYAPTFSVRDFGAGLSEDDLFGLYTKYGRSTKRNDNLSIGGFGIGRFAPLSYADSFTVTSRHNGTKTIVNVFVDEHGDTRFTKLASMPTTEPSGLEVSVATKQDDERSFVNAINACVAFSTKQFEVKNSEISPINWVVRSDNWGVYERSNYHTGSSVVMGGVAYRIEPSQIYPLISAERSPLLFKKFGGNSLTFNHALRDSNFILFMPIGSVAIHHSREQLEYNVTTKRVVLAALERAFGEIGETFQRKLAENKTFEAFIAELHEAQENGSPLLRQAARAYVFKFIDAKNVSHDIELHNVGNVECAYRRSSTSSNVRSVDRTDFDPSAFILSKLTAVAVIVDNLTKNKRLFGRAQRLIIDNNCLKNVIVVSEETARKMLYIHLLADRRGHNIFFASEIVPFSVARNANKESAFLVFDGPAYMTVANHSSAPEGEKFYYVKMRDRKKIVSKLFAGSVDDVREFYSVLNSLNRKFFNNQFKKVYGFLETAEVPENAVLIDDVLIQKINEMYEKFSPYISAEKFSIGLRNIFNGAHHMANVAENLPEGHKIREFVSLFKTEKKLEELSEEDQRLLDSFHSGSHNYRHLFPRYDMLTDEQSAATLRWSDFFSSKYPMVVYAVDSYNVTASRIKEIADYINFVDKNS